MLISLNDSNEVLSNKESGYGRYDVMIIPKDIFYYEILGGKVTVINIDRVRH